MSFKSKIKQRIKEQFGPTIKKTVFYRLYSQSVGDWWYPIFVLKWNLASLLTRRKKVNVDGVKFTLPCHDWITHFRWYLIRKKEPEVRYFIDSYVENGDVFFDVGANIGVFTLYAGKRYKDLQIYCFEPEYSSLSILKENVIKNQLSQNVKIYSVGISDFVGISQLHLQDLTGGAAAHTESREQIEKTDEGFNVLWSEGIATVTIDYICEQIGVFPNNIKIDTDGNEVKILNGAKKTLQHPSLKSLIIEIPHQVEKREVCRNLLKEFGFERSWSSDETLNEIWQKKK